MVIDKRFALSQIRDKFMRSRPRRNNDNGLAETKNGYVVRKLFGYKHIHHRHAKRFNPFLNHHRPCLFATELVDQKKPGASNASTDTPM